MTGADQVRQTGSLVDDLDVVVADACAALSTAVDRDWHVPATGLTWTCWGTIEHTADDLFAYAGQISPRRAALETYVPFSYYSIGDGEPPTTIHAEASSGNDGLVHVLDASGGLLSAIARRAPARTRGWHPDGVSDPSGFAAMGSVEVLLHLSDVREPLGLTWDPDQDVVRRALDRLFPDAPADREPWNVLLWATGRAELPGRARLSSWRWDSSIRE